MWQRHVFQSFILWSLRACPVGFVDVIVPTPGAASSLFAMKELKEGVISSLQSSNKMGEHPTVESEEPMTNHRG